MSRAWTRWSSAMWRPAACSSRRTWTPPCSTARCSSSAWARRRTNGSADLRYVVAAARSIGARMKEFKVIVDKSTVPVGWPTRCVPRSREELDKRGVNIGYAVVSNPEFLKEGAAVEDFMKPDRIVVGSDDEQATLLMRALYAPFTRNQDRMLVMDVRSAEFTKVRGQRDAGHAHQLHERAGPAGRATGRRHRTGAPWHRLGPAHGYQFLFPGAGYGGSCFPKDVKALIKSAADAGMTLKGADGRGEANEHQKRVLVQKVTSRFGENLAGRKFALWGLAFKPNTDDMREAPRWSSSTS